MAASGQLGAVSVRAKFSVAGIGGGATHPAPREACCLCGADLHPQPAVAVNRAYEEGRCRGLPKKLYQQAQRILGATEETVSYNNGALLESIEKACDAFWCQKVLPPNRQPSEKKATTRERQEGQRRKETVVYTRQEGGGSRREATETKIPHLI